MRRNPDKALTCLKNELKTFRALDDRNQKLFAASSNRSGPRLTNAQIHLLTEMLFFSAFRAYEQFLRNIFLLYCCETQPNRRKNVRSFIKPRSLQHAEELLKSHMPFLDWSAPDVLLERAETYLKDGYPLKLPLTTNMGRLRELKKVRNHIAHMSAESLQQYKKVVRSHYATAPLKIPRPGQYLLFASRHDRKAYYFIEYLDIIEEVSSAMV